MAAAERREQLLDVTLGLAGERGFHGLTIDAVARAAGVTRPVVYDLFGDLAGLLNALAEREEERALADLADVVPDDPGDADPDELVVRGLERYLAAVRAAPDRWRLVLHPPEGTPPALRARTEANRRRVLERLERLVRWGLARRGAATARLDTELLARSLQVLAEDAARLQLADPGAFPTERFSGFARRLLESAR